VHNMLSAYDIIYDAEYKEYWCIVGFGTLKHHRPTDDEDLHYPETVVTTLHYLCTNGRARIRTAPEDFVYIRAMTWVNDNMTSGRLKLASNSEAKKVLAKILLKEALPIV